MENKNQPNENFFHYVSKNLKRVMSPITFNGGDIAELSQIKDQGVILNKK